MDSRDRTTATRLALGFLSSRSSFKALLSASRTYTFVSKTDARALFITATYVSLWMGSNIAVLLLNKLLLTYGSFRHPVLLTFLHMASTVVFIWGLRSVGALTIQRVQSTQQMLKLVALAVVFALAVLCANTSLKFLAVSMNQAIGAATPVFAAGFAFLLQGEAEGATTYSTLLLVVGGVVLASGVEPDLHILGAFICFAGAAFRGLRAVLQAILLRPEEKLDSLSCLAYMAPVSGALTLVLTAILEPASMEVLWGLPWSDRHVQLLILANCAAAFFSNFYNMAVTKRTSALTIQVLGQCKGVISAVVSVACFHNIVPALGWIGYGVTVVGCILYGRCKSRSRQLREQWLKRNMSEAGLFVDQTGSPKPDGAIKPDAAGGLGEAAPMAGGFRSVAHSRSGNGPAPGVTSSGTAGMSAGGRDGHGQSHHGLWDPEAQPVGGRLKKAATTESLQSAIPAAHGRLRRPSGSEGTCSSSGGCSPREDDSLASSDVLHPELHPLHLKHAPDAHVMLAVA